MRHNRLAVFVHLVWATWDRHPLLVGEIERHVYRAIGAKCEELGADLVALGGVADHVHVLVRLPAVVSVADVVRHIKGSSTHLITHEIAKDQFFKWQGAYAAFSVSIADLPRVSEYIAHQREHHAAGSLIAEWENLPDPEPQP